MRHHISFITIMASCLFVTSSIHAQNLLSSWNFSSLPANQSSATNIAASLYDDNALAEIPIASRENVGGAFLAGTWNAGGGSTNLAGAIAQHSYFEVTLTPATSSVLNVDEIALTVAGVGPSPTYYTLLSLFASVNDSPFQSVGSPVTIPSYNRAEPTHLFFSTPDYSALTNNVTFRFYVYGSITNTTFIGDISDASVDGIEIYGLAVPEASAAISIVTALMLFALWKTFGEKIWRRIKKSKMAMNVIAISLCFTMIAKGEDTLARRAEQEATKKAIRDILSEAGINGNFYKDKNHQKQEVIAKGRGFTGSYNDILRFVMLLGNGHLNLEDAKQKLIFSGTGGFVVSSTSEKYIFYVSDTLNSYGYPSVSIAVLRSPNEFYREGAPLKDALYAVDSISQFTTVMGAGKDLIVFRQEPNVTSKEWEAVMDATEIYPGEVTPKDFGIGIDYLKPPGMPIIVSDVRLGSPAEEAGIKPLDRLIKIDGTDTVNLGVGKCKALLNGKEGTTVNVSVQRPNVAEAFEILMPRVALINLVKRRTD